MSKRPDKLDQINAFRAGFRHGRDTGAEVSPRQAGAIIESLPTTIPVADSTVQCFCNGCSDGVANDTFRYLLSYVGAQP